MTTHDKNNNDLIIFFCNFSTLPPSKTNVGGGGHSHWPPVKITKLNVNFIDLTVTFNKQNRLDDDNRAGGGALVAPMDEKGETNSRVPEKKAVKIAL